MLWLPCGKHTTLAMYEFVVVWLLWYTVQCYCPLDELNGVVAAIWLFGELSGVVCGCHSVSALGELNGVVSVVWNTAHLTSSMGVWLPCGEHI